MHHKLSRAVKESSQRDAEQGQDCLREREVQHFQCTCFERPRWRWRCVRAGPCPDKQLPVSLAREATGGDTGQAEHPVVAELLRDLDRSVVRVWQSFSAVLHLKMPSDVLHVFGELRQRKFLVRLRSQTISTSRLE